MPPDSWHGEEGESPTSCAQLSLLLHSAYPAVPILQLGCLIGDLSQPRETRTSCGVGDLGVQCMAGLPEATEMAGGRAGRGKAAEAWRRGSREHGESVAVSRSSGYPSSQRSLQTEDAACPRASLPGTWDIAIIRLLNSLYPPPGTPAGVCVRHTGPGPVCHRETLRGTASRAGVLFHRAQSPLVLSRVEVQSPSLSPRPGSKPCCLCMEPKPGACTGPLSPISTRQVAVR